MKEKSSLITGSIWKGMTLFALPLLFGNLFQQLYSTMDSLIVGKYLGENALAAVSSSSGLIKLMVDFFSGLFAGAGILVANTFGRGDKEKLSKDVHTTVALGLCIGILLTIMGNVTAPILLKWMNTPDSVMPESLAYFKVYFSGSLAFIMYNCCTGILRSVGDSFWPLIYLIIASIANIILDILFVGVFGWGAWSAALATIIAQGFSAVLCFYRLCSKNTEYRVTIGKIHFYKESFSQTLDNGLPSGFQNAMIAISNVMIQSSINLFGAAAMAGCGVWSTLQGFALMPNASFTTALSTFVSQNRVAKQYDRIKSGCRFGLAFCSCVSVLVGIVLFIWIPEMAAWFNANEDIIAYSTLRGRIAAPFLILLGVSSCFGGILRGGGRPKESMLTFLICWCLARVLIVEVGMKLLPDIRVVLVSYPLTWILSTVVFYWRYRKMLTDMEENDERI